MSDALCALDRAGLLEAVRRCGHSLRKASIFSPSGIEFEIEGEYVTLPRPRLDVLIARAAVEAGATFCRGELAHMRDSPDGGVTAWVRGCPHGFDTRVLVLATGAATGLARECGVTAACPPSAMGIRGYVQSDFVLDRMVGSYSPSIVPGYGWIFPLGNGLYNVGVVRFGACKTANGPRNVREAYDRFASRFRLAQRLLAKGRLVTPLKGAPLRCGLKHSHTAVRRAVVAIGETIGSTLPGSGEGIGKAMQTGEIAAEVIHEALSASDRSRLEDYPRRLEDRLRPLYRAYATAERWLSVTWVNDLLSWRMKRSRWLSSVMAGVFGETRSPREVFSLRGVVHSFIA